VISNSLSLTLKLHVLAHTQLLLCITGAGTLMEADIATFLQRWGTVVLAATATATTAATDSKTSSKTNSSTSSSVSSNAAAAGSMQT
jgi:hypothetical protein